MKSKLWRYFNTLVVLSLLLSATGVAAAPPPPGVETVELEIVEVQALDLGKGASTLLNATVSGLPFVEETEPNDTPATANALPGTQAVVHGNIWPVADLDYFSFSGNAGDRVYAATMTSFAAGATDTTLTLFDTDGTTIIEADVNDGSFAASSSSIAGATLPANGTYYLQVRATSATSSMRPYHLYFKLQSGTPVAETEPNNMADGGQPLPPSGWVSGAINPTGDNDVFTFSLNAGDTVYLGLDLDPERDGGTSWNGRLGLGAFGNPPLVLVVNDANTTSPNSEAFFFTVKEAGTYFVYVDPATAGTGDPAWTYHLSVAVFPAAPATGICTTYTSTNVPVVIPTGPALVTSTLTVPGNPIIADIDVTIVLTHTNMPDLDVVLLAPGGNQVVLFNDLGINTQQGMNLTLDDEAAIPMGSYTVMSGMIYQPPATRRLDWFDYQNAGGVWTLQVYDDLAANGGILQSWSITICEPPPLPVCPAGYEPVTVFSTDFEADDGSFTSAGVQNEWQWGAPNFAPITTCNSGVNCWVTDLTGTYNNSSNQDLFSPAVDLSGYTGPVIMRWAQKYQIENANWDNAFVAVQEVGGANPTRLWEWLGPTMGNQTVGSPTVTIPQSAGWSQRWADISAYAGQSIEARFNLSSDSSVNYAGLAIDDFSIVACQEVLEPAITLAKTVGTDPLVCATTDEITVPAGTDVTYCYEVTNTGNVTLNLHDLDDSELGNLLSGLSYALAPGASAFVTETATINVTTVNTAIWTAYNGSPTAPSDLVHATDVATVTVSISSNPSISLNKTVGTVPGVCALTDDITITAGTEVYYCYVVENTGDVTFNFHDLVDSELGVILNDLPYTLAPGAFSPQVIVPATPMATVTNVATWTAVTALGTYAYDDQAPFNYIPIHTTGTALNLTDDGEANITLPFAFTFYGVTSSNLRVGNNGGILFNATTGDVGITNVALPNAAAHPLAIFPFWDDLDDETGNVYWEVQGMAPNRMAIVEWYNRPHFNNVGSTTFQVILYETINEIKYQYLDVDFGDAAFNFGASATVGINKDATTALQYSFNQPVIQNGMAILFYEVVPESASDSDSATVTVLTPNIDVDPLSYNVLHAAPQVTTAPLTIANTGQGDLVWNIAEEPTRVPPAPLAGGDVAVAAEVVDASDFKVPEQAGAAAPLSAWRTPEAVLYDNGPLVTHPGAGAGGADVSAVQTDIGLGSWGFGNQLSAGNRIADDFTVTGGGWLVDTITFFAYQTGSSTTSTINHINLRIWDGPPNDPGSNVVFGDTTTNRLASTTWTNIYRTLDTELGFTNRPVMTVAANVNTFLPAGTYWVDWQVGGTLASGPWAPAISILGQATTGNALQFTSTGWATLVDGAFPQGFPFIIEGVADCSDLADVPWLSVSPANGVNAGGTSTVGTVTFDSTALTAGTYTANLCVFSNDPDIGPGNGTGLVIVPVELVVEELPVEPSIVLTKTVGTVPGVCATTDNISVPEGTEVYYCYQIENTGDVTLTLHDLVDTELGSILLAFPYTLAPGDLSPEVIMPATLYVTTVNTATWTAYNMGQTAPVDVATATATATVNVEPTAVSVTRLAASPAGGWSSVALLGVFALGGFTWKRKRR